MGGSGMKSRALGVLVVVFTLAGCGTDATTCTDCELGYTVNADTGDCEEIKTYLCN